MNNAGKKEDYSGYVEYMHDLTNVIDNMTMMLVSRY